MSNKDEVEVAVVGPSYTTAPTSEESPSKESSSILAKLFIPLAIFAVLVTAWAITMSVIYAYSVNDDDSFTAVQYDDFTYGNDNEPLLIGKYYYDSKDFQTYNVTWNGVNVK